MTGSGSVRGVALVATLLALGLLSALALSAAMLAALTSHITHNHREAIALANAAESAAALAMRYLAASEDWPGITAGRVTFDVRDTPPPIDLVVWTNEMTCGRQSECSEARIRASTPERPWGDRNPRWQVVLARPAPELALPGGGPPPYLIAWIGMPVRPDAGRLRLRAGAWRAGGAHRLIELDVARADSRLFVLAWRRVTLGS